MGLSVDFLWLSAGDAALSSAWRDCDCDIVIYHRVKSQNHNHNFPLESLFSKRKDERGFPIYST